MSDLISIVMPVKNGAKYIGLCIESIINQTYENWELIVINDGSTDRTVEIVRAYRDRRIIVHNSQGEGIVDALNTGISESKGSFIARMDADDVMVADRLEIQYTFLCKKRHLFGCGSNAIKIDSANKVIGKFEMPNSSFAIEAASRFKCPMIHPTVMFKSRGDYYDKKYEKIEDFEFWLRLISEGKKFRNIKKNLLYYRVHHSSISSELALQNKNDLLRNVFLNRLHLDAQEVNTHIKLVSNRKLDWSELLRYNYVVKIIGQVGYLSKMHVMVRFFNLLCK